MIPNIIYNHWQFWNNFCALPLVRNLLTICGLFHWNNHRGATVMQVVWNKFSNFLFWDLNETLILNLHKTFLSQLHWTRINSSSRETRSTFGLPSIGRLCDVAYWRTPIHVTKAFAVVCFSSFNSHPRQMLFIQMLEAGNI